MKITLLTIGKSNFPFVKEGMAMYEKRITLFAGRFSCAMCGGVKRRFSIRRIRVGCF